MEFVEVDGSEGEGGGQILRTSAAFAAILGRPVRVTRIRAGRGVPGLKRQHVSALRVLEKAFGGKVDGAHEGSSVVSFVPGDARAEVVSVDMGTAASITLVLQAVVPAAALSRRRLRLELTGGTDVPWSPTFDYLAQVVRAAYGKVGIRYDARAERRGYYPRGGGRVAVSIEPCGGLVPIESTVLDRPAVATVVSRCADLPRHVAERQLSSASAVLEGRGIKVLEGEASEEASDSPGSSVLVRFDGASTFIGADSIGARGKPAEDVGREAAARFAAEVESGACADVNLADMLLPILSLAPSPSRLRVREVTPHLKSGLEIAKKFTPCSWRVEANEGAPVLTLVPGRSP